MIITVSLVNFHQLIKLTDFFLWWEIWRPTVLAAYSSAMQCCQLYSERCTWNPQDFQYNWNFVPFHHLLLLSPPIATTSNHYQSVLYIYEFGGFIYFLLIFLMLYLFIPNLPCLTNCPLSLIWWHLIWWHIETVLISTYVTGSLCCFFGLRKYWGLHLEK